MNKQKNIFITGAASGIGLETARFFARKGWFVGITDLNEQGLNSLESELGSNNCFSHTMDVTDPENYQETVNAFTEKTGEKMNVLFNNAGILRMGPNETISLQDQHLTVDINIKGILNGIHCSLKYLMQTPGACIISMASTSAIYGMPELAVYSATKHAVCALTESLDIELEQYDISVCDIIVPYVNTPMVTDARKSAHSVEKTGVNVKPSQVAENVWKAVHGKKLHWKVHFLTHVLCTMFPALPFIRRPIVKYLGMTPVK